MEELGVNCDISLTVDVSFKYYPEEKMVRYYPDGSGYPGCDAYFELNSVKVLNYSNDVEDIDREDSSGDFAVWDRIAYRLVDADWDNICENLD